MHPLTYRVWKAIPQLEFEQFRHLEDRERLNEIRALAQEQVRDDTDEIGKNRRSRGLMGGEILGEEDSLWPEYNERQRAIIAGMEPVLDMVITAQQRVDLRQVYDERPHDPENPKLDVVATVARRYGITKRAMNYRLATIHKHLREALLKVYGPKEEA